MINLKYKKSKFQIMPLWWIIILISIAFILYGYIQIESKTTAIKNVRIFDGERIIPKGTVLFKDGIITKVGKNIAIPDDADVVDGEGTTLLPGLIDSHVHVFFSGNLQRALNFGVTTELDMGCDYRFAAKMREQQSENPVFGRADFFSAGTQVTSPGGHGTQFALKIPTIRGPEEAEKFVLDRIAEGSDYIKVMYDDGTSYGPKLNTISLATMKAVVEAAHKHGKMVVVHVFTLRETLEALKTGVDGLAHIFTDEFPKPEFAGLVSNCKAFVIPTLTAMESSTGVPSGASLAKDPHLTP